MVPTAYCLLPTVCKDGNQTSRVKLGCEFLNCHISHYRAACKAEASLCAADRRRAASFFL